MEKSLDHETIVTGMLLGTIGKLRSDGKKTLEITEWITKVRDVIKGLLPDYYFIICKFPPPFTQYYFEDIILEWCYVVKGCSFKVFVFRGGEIKDYEETGDITDFCCGGFGKIERVWKDKKTHNQITSLTEQAVFELNFADKIFDKDKWMEQVYQLLEAKFPDLKTNPKKYSLAGEYPEYDELFGPLYAKLNEELKDKPQEKDKKEILIQEHSDTIPRAQTNDFFDVGEKTL